MDLDEAGERRGSAELGVPGEALLPTGTLEIVERFWVSMFVMPRPRLWSLDG